VLKWVQLALGVCGRPDPADKCGALVGGHREMLGQALSDLLGWAEAPRLDLANRLTGAANTLAKGWLGEAEGFAALLKPCPERRFVRHLAPRFQLTDT
jgi:hypothetical protein